LLTAVKEDRRDSVVLIGGALIALIGMTAAEVVRG
jgi:hypothetical protein